MKSSVAVLCIHIGSSVDQGLGSSHLAMEARHMQWSVAVLIQIGDKFGIRLKKSLDFVGVALARRIVNWTAKRSCGSAEKD